MRAFFVHLGGRRGPGQAGAEGRGQEGSSRGIGHRVRWHRHRLSTTSGVGLTHDTWVMNRLSAAKQTAVLVANRGVGWAGKVAMVASPTRKTSKSCERFLYPAVVEQTHMSVL